jgi:replicative DNA helicase
MNQDFDKINGIDPRDFFFGSMMLTHKENQFEYFYQLKKQWFDIEYHKNLFDCLEACVEKGEEFNQISANLWFRENAKYSSTFQVYNLSMLTSKIGYFEYQTVTNAVNLIYYLYCHRLSINYHNKLGQQVNGQSFDLDKIKSDIDEFQKTLDEDYIDEVEESNEDIVNEIMDRHSKAKEGDLPGIELGFNSLKHVLIEEVDFMVIGARPSMGKTAFIMSSIFKQIFILNYTIIMFSLEMSKVQIMRRLISIGTGIPDKKIKLGECTPDELEKIQKFKLREKLKNLIIYEGAHKPSDLVRKVTLLKKKRDVHLVWVDYLQKLSDERKGMKKMEAVAHASNSMKNLAMNLKTPVAALAQLSRGVENRGGDKKPVLSDLRETGEIEQDADIVAFLHRPEYYGIKADEKGDSTEGKGEFILAKNRGDAIGPTDLGFDGPHMKWHDLDDSFANSNSSMPKSNSFENKKSDLPF